MADKIMGKKPRYQKVNGFRLPISFDPEALRSAEAFTPQKDEIIVVTYPKCGTTWMQQIVLLILRKGEIPLTAKEYFSSSPFLEMTGASGVEQMLRPGCIKTHLPFDRIRFSRDAKYIYVARHPADCVVSFYHHTRFFPIYYFTEGTFEDYFELFLKGEVDFNDYFDHLLSWYEHRDEPNVFFTTYEAMKADPCGKVLDIARFLGDEYYEYLVQDEGRNLEKVMQGSSVEYTKSTVNEYWKSIIDVKNIEEDIDTYSRAVKEAVKSGEISIGDFVRKGEIGEGKMMLSKQQSAMLEARILEKTAHSDVMKLWNR